MKKEKEVAEEVSAQQTAQEQTPSAEEKIATLEKQVEQLSQEKEKLTKTVARLQSSADKSDTYLNQLVAMKNDFESYKRRMKFSAEQAKAEGVQSVALKLIEIADTFEIARKHIADEETLKAFEMVHQQFVQVLHGFGVVEMDVKGQQFDHNTMNALSQMDYGEENSGKVVEVYKNGYTMGEKILRYAEVIVGA
ncbi:protein GrpE [Corallococcus sp. CAG:1435]|uniref:Protein GrpE n=1 Tax=Candidatus Fimimonas gallinarum TaxID=2840821 RepID=A0A9D1E4R9_9BACT|nr:protein GrpE [Corallococcus sp. CAG:1435]HIR66180.1 nucleotide exchange factor GrpE [Candidatus Fimimonas gallinarum]